MRLESNTISPTQLTFLAIGFLLGSSIILFPGAGAKNNAWLAIILGLGEGLILLGIYNWLAARHPGKSLVEINDIVLGPFLGKAFSLAYMLFFLYLGAQVLRTFGAFFSVIYTATPFQVFIIVLILLSASAVKNGIEVIARCSLLLVAGSILVFFFDFLLLTKNIDISNLLPFMDLPLSKFFLACQAIAALPFGEAVVFLMIMAWVRKPVEAGPAMKKAFILGGLLLVLYAVRNITVLGPFAFAATYPSFSALRNINVGDIFNRLDIAAAIILLAMGFIKVTVFYYATVLGTSQLFKMRSYITLVLPIGALMYSVSQILYNEYIYDLIDATLLFPFYSMLFAFVLPVITLIVAKIRKSGIKPEVNSVV